MADQYVTRCTLECDGTPIEDFKTFKEHEVTPRKAVHLMNKTGFAHLLKRYGFSLDYVVPESGAEFDFDGVENARFTVEYEGGHRRTFTGVVCTKIGESTNDGDNEKIRPIEFAAAAMTDE